MDPKDPSIEYDWFEVGVLSYDSVKEVFLVQKVNSKGKIASDNGRALSDMSSATPDSKSIL